MRTGSVWGGVVAFVSLFVSVAAMAETEPSPYGVWLSREGKLYGKAYVRVSDCGGRLCGHIVRLTQPYDKNGKPFRDLNNKNPALRSRPIINLPVLLSMRPTGPGKWEGKVYDPELGGIYAGYVTLLDSGRMKVTGCLMAIACRSYIWRRASVTASAP